MTTSKKLTNAGLDARIPERGAMADCFAVARTTVFLCGRPRFSDEPSGYPARHAAELHRVSGLLHRIAERQCSENLTCPACQGDGHLAGQVHPSACPKCAGEGSTLGRKAARLRAAAEEIAAHYGCRAYFQTDPRGCPLYLVPGEIVPAASELASVDVSHACSPKAAQYLRTAEAWIDSNYTRGHAVGRVGR